MELLEALNIIKETCKRHETCVICPLRENNDDGAFRCYILYHNDPSTWKITECPRAFED